MTSDFPSLLSSGDMVELLAQGGESRFFVHANILVSQSQPFKNALAGNWKEATERKIDLNDWDGDTVGRLVEFLYRGNYQYPDPAPISAEDATTPQGSHGSSGSLAVSVPPENGETETQRLRRFDPAQYDYGEALFSHAKVYQLAHYKSMDSLRELARDRLQRALMRLDPVNAATGALTMARITQLAQDIYANTDHLENHEEPLRSFISSFVARNLSALQTHKAMLHPLSMGGDFVLDVLRKVSNGPSIPWPSILSGSVSSTPTRYICKLQSLSADLRDAPGDRLRELNGTSGDVNWNCPDLLPCWIYVEYTNIASEAYTELVLHSGPFLPFGPFGHFGSFGPNDLEIRSNCRIRPRRELAAKKITEIALIRQETQLHAVSEIPAHHGTYDGMTTNIHWNRARGYLYIVWKSVVVF